MVQDCYTAHSKVAAEHAELKEWRAMREPEQDAGAFASRAAVDLKWEAIEAVEQANSVAPMQRKEFITRLWLKFHPGEVTLM